MSLVLFVRLPLILAAKLVGLFFTIALKKKKTHRPEEAMYIKLSASYLLIPP